MFACLFRISIEALASVSIRIKTLYVLNFAEGKIGKINIYLQFASFLDIDTTQVVEIIPQIKTRTYLYYIVNIMAADVRAT